MAGYFLYSLDWSKFRRFVERPTPTQLTVLTNAIRDQLRTHADQFTADDPCRSWPTDTDALAALVTERLGRSDWYSDLSETAKSVWDSGIFDACCGRRLAIGFRVESDDGVYWDIIDFINHRLGVPPRRTTAITTGAPRDVAVRQDAVPLPALGGLRVGGTQSVRWPTPVQLDAAPQYASAR